MELRCKHTLVRSEAPDRGIADVETFEIVQPPNKTYYENINKHHENLKKDNTFKNVGISHIKNHIIKTHETYAFKQYKERIDQYEKILCKMPIMKENFVKVRDMVKQVFYHDSLINYNKRVMINDLINRAQSKSRKIKSDTHNRKYIMNAHIEYIADELDNFNVNEMKSNDLLSLTLDLEECYCDELIHFSQMLGMERVHNCCYCDNKQIELSKKISKIPTYVSPPVEYIKHKHRPGDHLPVSLEKYIQDRKRRYKSLKKVVWLRPMTYEY